MLVSTITMSAGTYIEIKPSSDIGSGQGFFPKKAEEKVTINGVKDRVHTFGFVVEDEAIGTVEVIPGKELAVKYTHLKNQANRIYYFTLNNDQYTIAVIAMPIHDHSAISQGGPAYGTYSYDKKPTT